MGLALRDVAGHSSRLRRAGNFRQRCAASFARDFAAAATGRHGSGDGGHARDRGTRAQMSRDLSPDRVRYASLRPARLCRLRAQRHAGSGPRQPSIRRALSAERDRDGQAHRLDRPRRGRGGGGPCLAPRVPVMPTLRDVIAGPWRAVLVLGVTEILAWGTIFYPPVLTVPLIAHERGWSMTFAMGGFSLALLTAGLVSPRVGLLIDRHGGHRVMSIGSLI